MIQKDRICGPRGGGTALLAGGVPLASLGPTWLGILALLQGTGGGGGALTEAGGSLTAPPAPSAQRWGRAHGRVHHTEHRAGEDALRGGGGHVPDGEDFADAAAGHGADRGECPAAQSRGRSVGKGRGASISG